MPRECGASRLTRFLALNLHELNNDYRITVISLSRTDINYTDVQSLTQRTNTLDEFLIPFCVKPYVTMFHHQIPLRSSLV